MLLIPPATLTEHHRLVDIADVLWRISEDLIVVLPGLRSRLLYLSPLVRVCNHRGIFEFIFLRNHHQAILVEELLEFWPLHTLLLLAALVVLLRFLLFLRLDVVM